MIQVKTPARGTPRQARGALRDERVNEDEYFHSNI